MATIQTVDNFKDDSIQEASKSFSAGVLNSNWFIKSSGKVSAFANMGKMS